jgi:hypothetical protein
MISVTRLTLAGSLPFAQVIPEPEYDAMFLAGLGLTGFMERRKRRLLWTCLEKG